MRWDLRGKNYNDFKEDKELVRDDLQTYVESREISNNLSKFIEENRVWVEGPIYRGLPLPRHLLRVGQILEQWHGSSHWTVDMKIADNFSKDYVNEDYYEELWEERGQTEVEFIPVILILQGVNGFELYKKLEEYGIDEFSDEKEITLVGEDFRITSLMEITEDTGSYKTTYRAEVELVKKDKDGKELTWI